MKTIITEDAIKIAKDKLNKKIELCVNLSKLDIKKITKKEITKAANDLNLKTDTAILAWKNFVETGHPDLKSKNLDHLVLSKSKKANLILRMNNYRKDRKVLLLTPEQAKKLLKEYIFSKETVISFTKKYNMDLNQFYDIIKELNIKGTVLGSKVLDPKKYLKTNIKKIIKYNKKPYLFANMNIIKKANYDRVLIVLNKYL